MEEEILFNSWDEKPPTEQEIKILILMLSILSVLIICAILICAYYWEEVWLSLPMSIALLIFYSVVSYANLKASYSNLIIYSTHIQSPRGRINMEDIYRVTYEEDYVRSNYELKDCVVIYYLKNSREMEYPIHTSFLPPLDRLKEIFGDKFEEN